jgi:hypothetical protein
MFPNCRRRPQRKNASASERQRCHRMAKGVAKVAAACKLAVRLYWMLRTNTAYPEIVRIENSPRVPLVSPSRRTRSKP